jgi:hypothetical protein
MDIPTKRRDRERVVQWRRAQLVDAGLPRGLAARVARDERYDLHELVELVVHGCPPALAVRILAPVERADED